MEEKKVWYVKESDPRVSERMQPDWVESMNPIISESNSTLEFAVDWLHKTINSS